MMLLLLAAASGHADGTPQLVDQAPNCLVTVSARLAAAVFETPIDRPETIRDHILKADVFGSGHSCGRVTAQLVPCNDRAAIDLIMNTQMNAQTTGCQGPVQLHNLQTAFIQARKRIYLDVNGFCSEPACAHNQTNINLQGITTRFRRPMIDRAVRKMANKKFYRKEDEALQIVESHVDQRVRDGFDRDIAGQLDSANQSFNGDYRSPLTKRGIFPDSVWMSTTAERLTVAARMGNGAPAASPRPAEDRPVDLLVQLHESFLNTAGQRMFAGKTYTLAQLRADLSSIIPQNKPAPGSEDEQLIEMTFAPELPIEFRFKDNKVDFVIHTTRLAANSREYSGMDIGATYRLEESPQGVKAVRQGELQVYPMNHVRGQPLNSRQISMRAILKRHIGSVVPDQMSADQINLPDSLKKIGSLNATRARASAGWLVVGVDQSVAKKD
jgi:hypothetical protein